MADSESAVVSGRTRRLFPRPRFHFWQQRRHYTCILFSHANFHAVDLDKTAESQIAKCQFLLHFWNTTWSHGIIRLRIWSCVAPLVSMAINWRRQRFMKGHSVFFSKHPVRHHSWGQLYESKPCLRVVDSSFLCTQRFLPKKYLAKWVKPLHMPQLPCSVKNKTLLSRGVNIRQIWPVKASTSVSLTECWPTALLSNTPTTGGRFRRNKHASLLLQIPWSR